MIISIKGWETRLKSRRWVEGGWRIVLAVSCSSWICLMPISIGFVGELEREVKSAELRMRWPFVAKGSVWVSGGL